MPSTTTSPYRVMVHGHNEHCIAVNVSDVTEESALSNFKGVITRNTHASFRALLAALGLRLDPGTFGYTGTGVAYGASLDWPRAIHVAPRARITSQDARLDLPWRAVIPHEWAPRQSDLCDGADDNRPHHPQQCEHAILGPYGDTYWANREDAFAFVDRVVAELFPEVSTPDAFLR